MFPDSPMPRNWLLLAAVLPMLAACGGGATSGAPSVKSVSTAPPPIVRNPTRRPPPKPQAQVLSLPGLQGVIGATASDLNRQFGAARLDVWEGDARKLQYSGTACILDVFLYPPAEGREPQATYVDARRTTDGREVDRAACVAALRQR